MSPTPASDLLLADLKACLQLENPKGYDHGAVQKASLDELLIAFMNWRLRFIAPRPRRVHISSVMRKQLAGSKHAEALGTIRTMLEEGADVSPYLSTSANTLALSIAGDPPKKRRKKFAQMDRMLSDWCVYHLHLGVVPHEDDPLYVKRTRNVLFLLISPNDAYLIGVFEHEDWANDEVARIVVNEWLEESQFTELPAGWEPVDNVPPTEWLRMRESGISLTLAIDGRYFTTGNMTLAGSSIAVTERANGIISQLETLDALVEHWALVPRGEYTYRLEKRGDWYGLGGPTGFHHRLAFPWWYDGRNWHPPTSQSKQR